MSVKDTLLEVAFNLHRNSSEKGLHFNLHILLFGFLFAQEI